MESRTKIEDTEEYVKRLQNKLEELKAERIKVDQANELLQQRINLLNSRVHLLNEKYVAVNETTDSTDSDKDNVEDSNVKSEVNEENRNKENI